MKRKTYIINQVQVNLLIICAFMFSTLSLYGQSDKKYIRQGNKEFEKNNYQESEVSYRKALDQNAKSPEAIFNAGDALYKQNKYEDAGKQFIENINMNEDKSKKSAGLYNLGNSLLKANKLQESIDAYKGSLKLRPDNKEAKYNLAYAQDLMIKQQEQQKQQQNQDKNKDKNKQDQNKDQKDQKNNDQQKDQNASQDQKQQQEQGISKEDAQRLLNALANDEKNVQEKVKLAKASKEKVRTAKNW